MPTGVTVSKSIAIVGGGFTGLAAAYDLARSGWKVQVFEADSSVGGLAGTFEVAPGKRLERFYHHWFASDAHILDWLRELGLGDEITFAPTNTGLFFANSIFRLASPLDLLRFNPLPLLDRVRTGLMALKARGISDWQPLEELSAEEWIIKYAGRKSYEVIWKPLLQGKFGPEASHVSAVWFWNKLKLRGSSRDKKGAETLAYFRGSFGAATDAVVEKLKELGVEIRYNARVDQIVSENGRVRGVRVAGEMLPSDAVLATVPLPHFMRMTPGLPQEYVERHSQIRFLGNVCLVLRLKRSLSSTYWLNVADPSFPYVGIIEHTNFDDPANFDGRRIAYLSKYLPTSEAMFRMSDSELFEYSLPYIQRIFPEFTREWVEGSFVWRAEYSQPVITKHYSKLIPDEQTPIEGLWLSTMAQVYPEDRGTSYAVRHGRAVARRIGS
jgi:protoporphyrinogen oxidase